MPIPLVKRAEMRKRFPPSVRISDTALEGEPVIAKIIQELEFALKEERHYRILANATYTVVLKRTKGTLVEQTKDSRKDASRKFSASRQKVRRRLNRSLDHGLGMLDFIQDECQRHNVRP